MARIKDETYKSILENKAVYDKLYSEYVDYFGRGENNVMKTLKKIEAETLRGHK